MNILFINTSRSWGGNEKWTHMAANELAKKHNVFLAYRSEALGSRFSISKKRFMFLNRVDFVTLGALIRYIKNNNIDILVSTNRKYYPLGGIASRMGKCLHFVRCGIVWNVPDNLYYRSLFTRFIDGVIVNAESVRSELLGSAFISEKKVHTIYNGLDLDRLEQTQASKSASPFGYTIISSGELTPRKGHDLVIRGFAAFLKKTGVQDAGLIILGKGRQEKELKALAKSLGISDRIIFAGFIDNPYAVMAKADLFVTMSANEGISNALLEAMYLKLIVISTPAGGVKDVVSHGFNGFLVEHTGVDNLAALINKAYHEDGFHAKDMTENARKTILDNFSLEKMNSSLQALFSREIKSRKK